MIDEWLTTYAGASTSTLQRREYGRNNPRRKTVMEQFSKLSSREKEVLQLLLQGKSNKMIALSLGISISTVEFHLRNIYTKFQVSSRMELVLKLVNTIGGV